MYTAINLPYSYDALEPYIDALTVEIHYEKHLKTYVKNLNNILEGYESFTGGKSLEKILSKPRDIPRRIRQDVINQGGGVANHNLYFSILSPNPKKEPEGNLKYEIIKTFGSIENLKNKLSEAAISQFGSGYGFLARNRKGKICIVKTLNQNTPLSEGLTPILNIDVWEHAYYLKYKNLRVDYVHNIWNIINWGKVEELYNQCE